MNRIQEEWLVWPPLPLLFSEAEKWASSVSAPIPPSHRPLIGAAVTRVKRLALGALRPVRGWLLQPQLRFNAAALEACRRVLQGEKPPEQLAALAALPGALPATGALLARQIGWNRALVAALGAAQGATPEQARALHAPLADTAALAPGPLFELLRAQAEFDRVVARLAWALLGLHTSSVYEYRGYRIPNHLLELTGAGAQTWEAIARKHLDAYAQHAPIAPDHAVLEVGCGIGRDAMQLVEMLPRGRYLGVDITAPSIEWCRRNVTARHPHATFFHLDVQSDLYNPSGTLTHEQVALPAADGSIDRIILQSVFTHLFPPAIERYLREFRRVLKADGLVYTSLFVADPASLQQAAKSGAQLTFRHRHATGARIDSANAPEEAVALEPAQFEALVRRAGLRVVKQVPGSWPGRAADGYQDAAVLAIGAEQR